MTLDDLPLAAVAMSFGARRVQLIAAPDQTALLKATGDRDMVPFGLMLWESAVTLAELIAARDVKGLRILELGAGVGLPGIIAALGGAHVTQIDIDPLAMDLAERNARANGVADHIERRLMDWQHWPQDWNKDRSFDLVLGADVVYDTADHQAVIDVLGKAMKPDGVALLTEPSRVTTLAFLSLLEDQGWRVSTEFHRTQDLTSPGDSIDVQLIEVRAPRDSATADQRG
jgi:methyltransferase-like protein 23